MKITISLCLDKTILEPTYYLAALGAARVGLVQLHPWSGLLRLFRLVENVPGSRFSMLFQVVPGSKLSRLFVLVWLSLSRQIILASSVFNGLVVLLTGLLVPCLLDLLMLHNFTSSLASSIASLLQVGRQVVDAHLQDHHSLAHLGGGGGGALQ